MRFFANPHNDLDFPGFEGEGAWWRNSRHQAPFNYRECIVILNPARAG